MSLRILWQADAPWMRSGYGTQARAFLPRLQARGHAVAVHAWAGLTGGTLTWDGLPVYPRGRDKYGQDVLAAYVADFEADLVISLVDVWVLDPSTYTTLPARWLPYAPIDLTPVPPAISTRLSCAPYPATYSQWGRAQLAQAGIAAHYLPLGVDTAVFTPGDQAAARERLGWPTDGFVVSMVAANQSVPSRKGFPECLQAFAQFRARHPDARLYLHTRMDPGNWGLDLVAMARTLDLLPALSCLHPRQSDGVADTDLADIYRASDLLLAGSMSEGFGIPIVEAQASGTPVVTTAFSSMPELTINGECVAPLQRAWIQWHPSQCPDMAGWQVVPSVDRITDALERLHARGPMERRKAAERGVAFVREHFSWDAVVRDHWTPLLARIEADIRGVEVVATPETEAVLV